MKRLTILSALFALLFAVGCTQISVNVPKDFVGKLTVTDVEKEREGEQEVKKEEPPPDPEARYRSTERTGKDIDVDDNDAVDIPFGGTNANNASGARTALGLSIGVNVQAWNAILDDLAGLTPEKGAIPYWLTTTTMGRLRFNQSDIEGYILKASGAYPNTVPTMVNTLNVTKLLFPNSANPTTDTEAQCNWDTNNRGLECYDDSSQFLTLMRKINTATVTDPDSLPVSIVTIMDGHETAYPFGIVLKAAWIDCDSTPAADYVVTIEEWTDGNDATVEAYVADCGTLTLTGATDYENEITSFSDANIAAGNLIKADFDNTDWAAEDFDECRIGVIYEIEDGN